MDYSWALNQTAVYWKRLSPDGHGGWDYGDPDEIYVRWEDVQEDMMDAAGEEFVSRAEVMVNQEMFPGDYLYLGELTSAMGDSAGQPVNFSGAWPVRRVENIPDFEGTSWVRTVWL